LSIIAKILQKTIFFLVGGAFQVIMEKVI